MAGDAVAVVDLLRQALVARVQHVDVVLLRQQVHDVDVLCSVRRPAGHEDQRLAMTGFPVGELRAIIGGERIHLKAGEVRKLLRHARNGVREREIVAKNRRGRCRGSQARKRRQKEGCGDGAKCLAHFSAHSNLRFNG